MATLLMPPIPSLSRFVTPDASLIILNKQSHLRIMTYYQLCVFLTSIPLRLLFRGHLPFLVVIHLSPLQKCALIALHLGRLAIVHLLAGPPRSGVKSFWIGSFPPHDASYFPFIHDENIRDREVRECAIQFRIQHRIKQAPLPDDLNSYMNTPPRARLPAHNVHNVTITFQDTLNS
jgi:hypothetical protein